MATGTVLIILLIFMGLVVSSIDVLPLLVLAFLPTYIRSSFDNDASRQVAKTTNPNLRSQLDALEQMGFTMLGVKVEQMPLWGRTYREADLASTSLQTYASIILHPDTSPANFYCYTPLQGGGLVFTRNFAQGVEAEGERVSVRNVDSPILSVVVEDHARRVQAMDQRGLVPIVDTTQQARLEATRAFYASEYARSLRPSLRTPAVRRFALRVAIFLLLAVLAGLIR